VRDAELSRLFPGAWPLLRRHAVLRGTLGFQRRQEPLVALVRNADHTPSNPHGIQDPLTNEFVDHALGHVVFLSDAAHGVVAPVRSAGTFALYGIHMQTV